MTLRQASTMWSIVMGTRSGCCWLWRRW
ncbi:hypothetical protein HaLaN_32949, partial [Haematococcus lacustris]